MDGLAKFYIGSSKDIYRRLLEHMNENRWVNNSKLYNSLNKHGKGAFQILILETLESGQKSAAQNMLPVMEQKYFDQFHPTLNILVIAGTVAAWNSKPIVVVDTLKVETIQYVSMREAARALNSSHSAIQYCLKNNTLLFNRFKFELVKEIK